MQEVTEDVFIIKVATGNEQVALRLNSDCDGSEMVRHLANIMRMMTFTSSTIISASRDTAEELESDMIMHND